MRTPRLYLPQALARGETIQIGGQSAHHIKHVLRLRPGTGISVFDGQGNEYNAVLVTIDRAEVSAIIGEHAATIAEPALQITLAQGIARNDRMDIILQKAVELGVTSIQPLWMQRCQTHLKAARLEKRIQHWLGIIISACEQCGRSTLPHLAAPDSYQRWINSLPEGSCRLMLQPEGSISLRTLAPPRENICVLIGPEGGLNPDEQLLAGAAGFLGVRLGPRILRTETAALTALAGMQTLWGDYD
jgi:16S rRNA (uracil1498-N3)-methyltransferase